MLSHYRSVYERIPKSKFHYSDTHMELPRLRPNRSYFLIRPLKIMQRDIDPTQKGLIERICEGWWICGDGE